MTPFTGLRALAAPLPLANIDTDQLVPARFLGRARETLGDVLFHDLRFDDIGAERPHFVLNDAVYRNAEVLVTLDNFGCGSSREAAVWALQDHGFRAVVAPSFGDIFYNNAFKNGLLPIVLRRTSVDKLLAALLASAGATIEIDLTSQTVYGLDGFVSSFDIDSYLKESLLNGRDELAMTLTHMDRIEYFEAANTSA
jgi:3-isopropylmalate/(R)-2-methylmalate dehydratase small subunit